MLFSPLTVLLITHLSASWGTAQSHLLGEADRYKLWLSDTSLTMRMEPARALRCDFRAAIAPWVRIMGSAAACFAALIFRSTGRAARSNMTGSSERAAIRRLSAYGSRE